MPAIVIDIYTRTATQDSGTQTKLEQQEMACRTYCQQHGLTVEQASQAFPLTLADVYAALAYYHDHRDEVDAHLQEIGASFGTNR